MYKFQTHSVHVNFIKDTQLRQGRRSFDFAFSERVI